MGFAVPSFRTLLYTMSYANDAVRADVSGQAHSGRRSVEPSVAQRVAAPIAGHRFFSALRGLPSTGVFHRSTRHPLVPLAISNTGVSFSLAGRSS